MTPGFQLSLPWKTRVGTVSDVRLYLTTTGLHQSSVCRQLHKEKVNIIKIFYTEVVLDVIKRQTL